MHSFHALPKWSSPCAARVLSQRFPPPAVGLTSFGVRRARSGLSRSAAAVGAGCPSFGGQRTVCAGSRSGALVRAKCFVRRAVHQGQRGLPVLRQPAHGGGLRRRLVQPLGASTNGAAWHGWALFVGARQLVRRPRAREAALVRSALSHSRA
jgi:hypothetical protein